MERPCCRVDSDGCFVMVDVEHYEDLRERCDRRETGGIELRLALSPGRTWLRIEDIEGLTEFSQAWCDAKNAQDAEDRARAALEDG